jgi:hypothetical protein
MKGSTKVVAAGRDSTVVAHHGGNLGLAQDLLGAQNSEMRRNLHGDQIG